MSLLSSLVTRTNSKVPGKAVFQGRQALPQKQTPQTPESLQECGQGNLNFSIYMERVKRKSLPSNWQTPARPYREKTIYLHSTTHQVYAECFPHG